MTLRLNGSTSGYVELDSPATGDSSTVLLPTGGNGTLGRMQLATAQNSTSGTSIDFTGIPSWVKRVTVMFGFVSTTGTSDYIVRVGSGSYLTTSYSGTMWSSTTSTQRTDGFPVFSPAGGAVNNAAGICQLTLISSNIWVQSGNLAFGNVSSTGWSSAGMLQTSLSGSLDRIRITTANGTDTFDAGSVNILYEG